MQAGDYVTRSVGQIATYQRQNDPTKTLQFSCNVSEEQVHLTFWGDMQFFLSSCLPSPPCARRCCSCACLPWKTSQHHPRQTRAPPRSHPSDPSRAHHRAHPTARIAPAPPENPHPLVPPLPPPSVPLRFARFPPTPSFLSRGRRALVVCSPASPRASISRSGRPRAPRFAADGCARPRFEHGARLGRIRFEFPPLLFFGFLGSSEWLNRPALLVRFPAASQVRGCDSWPWPPPTTARRRPGEAASSGAPRRGPRRGRPPSRRRMGPRRRGAPEGTSAASRRRRRSPRGR